MHRICDVLPDIIFFATEIVFYACTSFQESVWQELVAEERRGKLGKLKTLTYNFN